MEEKRFTEQQVADIIRRATEAQSARHASEVSSGSISASEVRRIGAELGVDPEALEAAMSKTVTWTAHDTGSVYASTRTFERRLPGALTDADYAEVLTSFEPFIGGEYNVHVGRTLNYTAFVDDAMCSVTFAESSEGRVLRVRSTSTVWILPVLGPFLLTVVGPVFLFSWWDMASLRFIPIGILVLLAMWSLALWYAFYLMRSNNQKLSRRVDELATRMCDRASAVESSVRPALRERDALPAEEPPRIDHRLGGT